MLKGRVPHFFLHPLPPPSCKTLPHARHITMPPAHRAMRSPTALAPRRPAPRSACPARPLRRAPAPPSAAAAPERAMPGWDRIYSYLVGRDSGLALPPLPRPFASTPAADAAAAVSAGKAVIVDVRPADRCGGQKRGGGGPGLD